MLSIRIVCATCGCWKPAQSDPIRFGFELVKVAEGVGMVAVYDLGRRRVVVFCTAACLQRSKTKAGRLRKVPPTIPEGGAYGDGEVLGLDADGCVIRWNQHEEFPYNTGQTLEEFGVHKLSEPERARVAERAEKQAGHPFDKVSSVKADSTARRQVPTTPWRRAMARR